jgi:peptide/nickel transport system permease protein
MKKIGLALLVLIVAAAAGAPFIAPHGPGQGFPDRTWAPPMRIHLRDVDGGWHRPFFYQVRLADRLESRYEEDTSRRIPLVFFSGGVLARAADEQDGPWLPFGGDRLGRDVLARTLYGARTSLGVAALAVIGSLFAGGLVGAVGGYFGGAADEGVMRVAEFVLVLPTIYVVLALRAALPLVLSPQQVFALLAGIFALVGWPWVARGVRGIVAGERGREYVEAARAAGAGHARILVRHILPATYGHLGTQATLLVPSFVLAEATLSYVGLGFTDPTPSWGTMLQEASNVATLARFPWLLVPAAGVFLVVLAVNLVVQEGGSVPVSTPGLGPRRTGRSQRIGGLQ